MRYTELLAQLKAEDNLRTLPDIALHGRYIEQEGKSYLNLSSSDYLGIACGDRHRDFMREMANSGEFLLSNPSSRLIAGNSDDYTRLEATISSLFGGKAALVLGSGYLLNNGILPALTAKGDLIVADKLIHASLIDGMRLSDATCLRFRHNDTQHLEKILEKERNNHRDVWIVTESIFSMDGDYAPLTELVALKQKYNTKLYVDEAHAFGVCGPCGAGVASALGVTDSCDILIATLGKAMASQGSFVVCDPTVREVLVNRMRTLIFSTALPPISLRWSELLIRSLEEFAPERERLKALTLQLTGNPHASHIVPIVAGENSRALEMSRRFREAGFWVMPIRYPTVPQGAARVRVSLSAAIEPSEIETFIRTWKSIG